MQLSCHCNYNIKHSCQCCQSIYYIALLKSCVKASTSFDHCAIVVIVTSRM